VGVIAGGLFGQPDMVYSVPPSWTMQTERDAGSVSLERTPGEAGERIEQEAKEVIYDEML